MNHRLLMFLLLAGLLRADTLSDLKSTLAHLNGQDLIKASVEYQFWSKQGDDKTPVIEERVEPWQGKPAKRLGFKLTPRLSRQNQKYVKEVEATATVWIGADGLPLAAESQTRMKVRALLVISFE